MLSKKQIHTEIVLSYQEDEKSDELTILFVKDEGREWVRIGRTMAEAKKSKPISFDLLREIVRTIDEDDRTQSSVPKAQYSAAPKIIDYRDQQINDTLDLAVQELQKSATEIQEQVNDTMSRLDSSEQFTSLSGPKKLKSQSEIVQNRLLPTTDDPIGFPPEAMVKMGDLPETPENIKEEMKKFSEERKKPKDADSSKRIRRKS